LNYEVYHRSNCFVYHSFCLLNYFEALQNSCLPVSIPKLPSTNVSQSRNLLASISKLIFACVCLKVLPTNVFQSFCLPMFVSKLLFTNLFQNSYLCVSVSNLLSPNCVSQSSYLPLYVSKLLSTSLVSKLISITIYLHEFWKVYEFWSSSQAWFILPYNISKSVSKVMNFQAPQSSSSMCHNLFHEIWKLSEFLSSSQVTLYCPP
jgi:hypothetical protein